MSDLAVFDERRLALAFSDYLRLQGIDNRLEARAGRHAVVLLDTAQQERAQQELRAFVGNPGDPRYWQASWQVGTVQAEPLRQGGPSVLSQLRRYFLGAGPVTSTVMLLCIAVFIGMSLLGDAVYGALRFPASLDPAVIDGQWWRFLTPALLHFSMLHIVFNLLWWRELGLLVERTQSSAQLLGVTLLTALISNVGQFLSYGPDFGGLSAVVYGLLGYVWLYPYANPAVGFRLRPLIVWWMVGWLLLGYTGLLDPLAGGSLSNNGHLIGLIAGCVLGLAFGLLNRGKPGRPLQPPPPAAG